MSLMGTFAPSWPESLLSGNLSPTYMTGFYLLFFLNTQTKKMKVSTDATWFIHSRQKYSSLLYAMLFTMSPCHLKL